MALIVTEGHLGDDWFPERIPAGRLTVDHSNDPRSQNASATKLAGTANTAATPGQNGLICKPRS